MHLVSRTLALLAAAALAACQPSADSSSSETAPPTTQDVTATPAPDPEATEKPGADNDEVTTPALSITTLDGSLYDLGARRGKWVVVNFWATWCAPCLKEMPELSALDAMHEHIEVIGLAYEDIEPDAMRDFLKRHPVVYPIAIIDTFEPPEDFDTPRGLPMTYLIAPDGTVAKKILGPVTAEAIEDAIAAAGGPAAAPAVSG